MVIDYTIDSLMMDDAAVKSIKRHNMKKSDDKSGLNVMRQDYRQRLYDAVMDVLPIVERYEEWKKYETKK